MRFLFLLFIAVPVVEMLLLIKVGGLIGAWPTVGLVLLTAFIGINLLRQQGLSTLMRAQSRMQSGEMPGSEIAEGLLLAVGGALLLTPGFITDAFGFACLLPFTRKAMVQTVLKSGRFQTMGPGSFGGSFGGGFGPGAGPGADPTRSQRGPAHVHQDRDGHSTIDGEFKRED